MDQRLIEILKLSRSQIIEINKLRNEIRLIQDKSGNISCFYSVMIGSFDSYKVTCEKSGSFDHFLITDAPLSIDGVSILVTSFFWRSNRRTNRFFKILPFLLFETYSFSIYYDSNLVLKNEKELYHKFSCESHLTCFQHNKRDCSYSEIEECIFWSKDSRSLLVEQKYHLLENNFPNNFGLFHGAVLGRWHNKLIDFSVLWWQQYDAFSARDQISFAYVIYKCSTAVNILAFSERSTYFKSNEHISKKTSEHELILLEKLKLYFLNLLVKIKRCF